MRILGLIIALLLLSACATTPSTTPGTWIDVRTVDEYALGHIPQAINIPYDEISERIGGLNLDSDQPIYLYCRSGKRAGIAQETLVGLGYSQVTNVGGYDDAQQYLSASAETPLVQ